MSNLEQFSRALVRDLTATIEKFDNGLTTKAEMYETVRMLVEDSYCRVWNDGVLAGIEEQLEAAGYEMVEEDDDEDGDPGSRPDDY